VKGTAMFTLPYRTLMHYKRWATNGLNAVIAETLDRMPADERTLVRRLLDHIQASTRSSAPISTRALTVILRRA
jgi:hypothetical protein